MKKSLLLLAAIFPLFLAFVACSDADEAEFPNLVPGLEDGDSGKPAQKFKVMTFNVRVNSVDTAPDAPRNWEVRKKAAVALIKDKQPTIMGVQEAYYVGQWDYLKETLAPEGYECVGKPISDWSDVPTLNSQVVGIFYRPDEVTLLRWGVFSLSETPYEPCLTPGLGASYIRGATWAEFRLNDSERRIFFLNTHLDTKSSSVRKAEIDLILSMVDKYNEEGLVTFMTADWNEDSKGEIFDVIKRRFNLARTSAPEGDIDGVPTFNNYGSSNTYLDHIWFSISSRISIDSYYVVREQYFDDVPYVSDHWPSYAVFNY